jgi:ATP adenylyltransferase
MENWTLGMTDSLTPDNRCVFCDLDSDRVISENNFARSVLDGYPVTKLHTLIIPRRHCETYFDLTDEEREACHQLLIDTRAEIQKQDSTVDGFNIGINNGEAAGQTVFHCHIHLIPRRSGDVENPRGGVRGVIPDKRLY